MKILIIMLSLTLNAFAQPALWDFTIKAAGQAIARVQYASTNATDAVETQHVDFTNAIKAGDLIVVGVRVGNSAATFNLPTDTLSNTYTFVTNVIEGANSAQSVYYATNTGAGANTVTATWVNPGSGRMIAIEYRGLAVNAALDKFASASGSSTAFDTSSVTITSANEVLIGFGNYNNSVDLTAGSGYGLIVQIGQRYVAEERFVTATGAYTADGTFSSTAPWAGIIATFK